MSIDNKNIDGRLPNLEVHPANEIIAGKVPSHSNPDDTFSQPSLAAILVMSNGIKIRKPQQAANEIPSATEMR